MHANMSAPTYPPKRVLEKIFVRIKKLCSTTSWNIMMKYIRSFTYTVDAPRAEVFSGRSMVETVNFQACSAKNSPHNMLDSGYL